GDARHFPAVQHTVWDRSCRVLRLASERTLSPALSQADAFAVAQNALENTPRAIDALENVASWDAASSTVLAKSYLPDLAPVLPLEDTPTDLCNGYDGVLYAVLPGRIRMHDLRGRWADTTVALAGFSPWRMTPLPEGGAWVMERNTGRLARLSGRPLRSETPLPQDYDARVFRPTPENCCPPQLQLVAPPGLRAGETPVALCASGQGAQDKFAVLSWLDGDGSVGLRSWVASQSRLDKPLQLVGANYAYAFTWLSANVIAVRVPGRRDAPAFDLSAADINGNVMPLGDVYPLSDAAQEAPFANGIAQPPQYPSGDRSAEPLYALSLNNLARNGEASNFASTAAGLSAWQIDSNDTTTVWHRLYAEAAIPAHTGFVVWLAASNDLKPPPITDLTAWHAHGFGRDIATLDAAMLAPQVPTAAWEPQASELPGHPGLLGGDLLPGTRGLFSVLVQNSRQRVRKLVGRYLWVRVVMHGDGRSTPDIAALRAWGSRFSYVDQYLPRIYRESLFGDAATAPGQRLAQIEKMHAAAFDVGGPLSSTLRARLMLEQVKPGPVANVTVEQSGNAWLILDGSNAWRVVRETVADSSGSTTVLGIYSPQSSPADFTARLLGNFEGMLTQLEDRVAAAHLFSDPGSVPEENLDWLASWIGIAFDPVLPAERRREWLRAAPDLARWHGTRNGLRLALDVATGGGVRSGEIVVVENFRLRRILATLLGVDLSDQNDPLLPGLAQSGNSIVGDTLFVGDYERAELLAFFNASVATDSENAAVISFDERLANRAVVLVHNEVAPQDFALIRRIAQLESPAHVEVTVSAATWPFLVGIASLVGVDTYLSTPRQPQPVRADVSTLGMGDFVIVDALLDPRLSGTPGSAPIALPVADLGPDFTTPFGKSFTLDGSASHAAPGHAIDEYRWRQLPPEDV
ncbi:MAG: tail protein, partial [Rhodocyclales bacterium]|nr:tail protein [Rhodocyclales bacterium]